MLSGCVVADPSYETQNGNSRDTEPVYYDTERFNGYEPDTDLEEDGGLGTDECPDDPEKLSPGICGCGVVEEDFDEDGTPDCMDDCPEDDEKFEWGQCGCGIPDDDSDGDGIADCNDGCPDDPLKTDADECDCGQDDDTCGSCTDTLLSKERLYVGDHLCSENGEFMFGMRIDGDLALWTETETLWSAGVTGGDYTHMQLLGNLVVYDVDLLPIWASNTNNNPGAYLTLENDGRVIIWLDGGTLWEIGGDL